MSLSYEDVAEILKIIDSSSCDEVIVETGDIKLVVRRNTAPGHAAPAAERAGVAPAIAAPLRPRADATASPRATAERPATAGQVATTRQFEVTAPMVGTFYRAPSPDAAPFVEIGTLVQPGQPLCIIEVMKLFTTINSECAGRVMLIGAETGDLVEYGHMLFVIEPAN